MLTILSHTAKDRSNEAMKQLIKHISHHTHKQFHTIQPLSGGSISSAYLLQWDKAAYFLKANSNSDALEMFMAEQKGLRAIESTATIAVPKVHQVDVCNNKVFF